jgi:transposase
VKIVLPQAKVVIDKFHVVRMANVAMEQVRKSLRITLPPKERRGLMHDRFILLKRERDLTGQDRFFLDVWRTRHPELGEAYRLKEGFYAIYDAEDKHDAVDRYIKWAASIPQPLKAAFSPITTAWRSWHDPILNYFDHPITNAYTESLNSLIRVMDRLGRGYSFEALRAKILFTEGVMKSGRPRFERKRKSGRPLLAYMQTDYEARAYSALDWNEPDDVNLGTSISTLTTWIEEGRI